MRTATSLPFLILAVTACTAEVPTAASPDAAAAVLADWPVTISLPDGFWPEGIAAGRGTNLYVGSIATGGIYRVDARTGTGDLLVAEQPGGLAGLEYDPRGDRLFAGSGSNAYVFDATTGTLLAEYTLGAFINDAVVMRDAVYFTDSFIPVLHRLPLGQAGALPDPDAVEAIPLTGATDWVDFEFNANGIVATANGKQLIVVNTTTGSLYLIDAATGAVSFIDLGGDALVGGDGMLLIGNRLYVVLGETNTIAVVRLSADHASGTVEQRITHPNLRFPSTIAQLGNALYAVNARFDVDPTPETEYEVVRIPR